MHTIIWILSALLAGTLARVVTRSRSRGFVIDTALGTFGSVAGAWLLRFAHGDVPAGNLAHIATSLTGAIALIFTVRLVRPLAERAGAEAARLPMVGDLEERLRRLSGSERLALEGLLRPRLLQDPNATFRTELTLGQRVADRVATFGGSWAFLGFFAAFMLGWMFLNTQSKTPVDPYPFMLLNLVLSCLPAVQAPVIMMSQNRQSARDRFDAKQDY